jgi:hypothetical protein
MLESIISTSQHQHLNGIQILFNFENGLSLSAVSHDGSMGGHHGLWEIAVFSGDKMIHLKTITGKDDEVAGSLTFPEVLDFIQKVSEL